MVPSFYTYLTKIPNQPLIPYTAAAYLLVRCLKNNCALGHIPQSATTVSENGSWQACEVEFNIRHLLLSFCCALGVSHCVHFFTNGLATCTIRLVGMYLGAPAVRLDVSGQFLLYLATCVRWHGCQAGWTIQL